MDQVFSWDVVFTRLWEASVARYRDGQTGLEGHYTEEEVAFLRSIGYRPREFFDFVEDYANNGEPSPTAALLVASVRRDYFLWEQRGEWSDTVLTPADLPSKTDTLGGIPWLPRILAKARGKLRGELDPDVMYSCPGDMAFLKKHRIPPADFLRAVWGMDEDEQVVEYVKADRG